VLTLGKLLDDALFRGARRLAGGDAGDARLITWFSVIEWPVEDFVQAGDVVMTTAVGCDEARFVELVAQVVARDPAGVLFALSDESAVAGAPAAAVAIAEEAGVPLVQLPWSVRFAEVARAVVEQLAGDGRGVAGPAVGVLGGEFVSALLGEGGNRAIAEAAEARTALPVVVLGADLRVEAAGPRARTEMPDLLERFSAAVEMLPAAELLAIQDVLERTQRAPEQLERLGLPPGVVVRAESTWRTVGYVFAAAGPGRDPDLDELRQAAQAVAVEQLRARAIAEADVRAHGDLLWAIARGDVTDADDIARRAALVGYAPSTRYAVAVGLPSTGSAASNDEVTLDAVTLPRLRRHGVHASRSEDGVLLVAPANAEVPLPVLLRDAAGATWGVADDAVTVAGLRDAYERARDTAVAASAVGTRGGVAQEHALGPYVLLTRLQEDPSARRTVEEILGGLLEYDRRTARNLMQSLAVYLAANGNTSAAARELHLNRHSLLYRLHKIEALTGRDLESHDDRFLLDLALRLWRVSRAQGASRPDGSYSRPG
jgi:purine catabolism regulator